MDHTIHRYWRGGIAAVAFVLGCTDAGSDAPSESEGAGLEWGDRSFPRECRDDGECRRGYVCDRRGCDAERGVCVRAPEECSAAWRPHCGCDGVTYQNACERLQAGAALAHRGVCRDDVCGGIAGEVCDEGEVCRFELGSCGDGDQQGICIERPEVCPDIFAPVCGCDEVTYGNRCEALANGVSIRHLGPCDVACKENAQCAEGELCKKERCFGEGVCTERPEFCTDEWDPVCGCDNVTYSNACTAWQTGGVSIAHRGECEPRPCLDDSQCRDAEYCNTPRCADAGTCSERPELCPEILEPVCGCDGKTYDNRCFAAMNGVSVAHAGRCARECGGATGYDCEEGEFCDPDAGLCAIASPLPPPGTCVTVFDACDTVYRPVCGCDGKTYSNDCERIRARVGKQHDGACEQICGGIIGVPCDEGELCDLPAGECNSADLQGVCVTQGDVCPLILAPVCGCDGVTYDNDCFRIIAGVQKDHDGRCDSPCCSPVEEPGQNGNPFCFEGASCCASGQWRCNDASAQPTCDVIGHVCECPGVACTLACEFGFAAGPDGCPICECRPAPCCDPADMTCAPDQPACASDSR